MTVGWFLKGLNQYADFGGRAQRAEYWWFLVVAWLVGVALMSFTAVSLWAGVTEDNGFDFEAVGVLGWTMLIITVIALVYLIVPYWAVTVRRLHDTGRSGWWSLFLLFVPLVVYILALFDSEVGTNQYGPDPKASERETAA